MISPICFHNFFDTLTSVHQYDTRQATEGDIFIVRKHTLQYGNNKKVYFDSDFPS